jgi:microcystin-dependent protein
MEPFLGQIILMAINFAPKGWQLCNGQSMPISGNQALYTLLGTYFGGDGVNTFNLPDLRSRAVFGAGAAPYAFGKPYGTETVKLAINDMPVHNHILAVSTAPGEQQLSTGHIPAELPGVNFYNTANPDTTLYPGTIGAEGGGQSHSNMQPYLVLNYMIATSGSYPTRA